MLGFDRGCKRADCHMQHPDFCNAGLPFGCEENIPGKFIGCYCHTDLCNGEEGWTTGSLPKAPPPPHEVADLGSTEFMALNKKLDWEFEHSYWGNSGQPNSSALLEASSASDPSVCRPVMIVNTMMLLFVITAQRWRSHQFATGGA